MSGGGGSLQVERAKRGKAKKRKKMKRVGFVLDMTPLVDITFLLLTFFMFTTTMAAPQVMEMSVPPEKDEVEVAISKLLQIYIRDDNKIFYGMGDEDPQSIGIKEIKALAEKSNLKEGAKNELITSLKVDNNAYYGVVVSILDELNLAEVKITNEIAKEKDEFGKPKKRERRFTIGALTEDDIVKLKEAQ